LPRHFLMLLNTILSFDKRNRKSFFVIRDDDILQGIRRTEERIVTEIFTAFRPIYPTAEETCKSCIPELPHHFDLPTLHKTYNRYGKKFFAYNDFYDFKRMLLEIGAIGRFVGETELYYQARYEYTVPHELVTSVDDTYCVHPLFSGIYSNGKNSKPVYPYGVDWDSDEDYRDK